MILSDAEIRKKTIDTIITKLGGNVMEIELDISTIDKCIDLAIAKLKQRTD